MRAIIQVTKKGRRHMTQEERITDYLIALDTYVDQCYAEMQQVLDLTLADYFKTVHYKSRVSIEHRPKLLHVGKRHTNIERIILTKYQQGVKSPDPTRNKSVEAIVRDIQAELTSRSITSQIQ